MLYGPDKVFQINPKAGRARLLKICPARSRLELIEARDLGKRFNNYLCLLSVLDSHIFIFGEDFLKESDMVTSYNIKSGGALVKRPSLNEARYQHSAC